MLAAAETVITSSTSDDIYQRHRDLVAAVLTQGVRDIRRGDRRAIAWLDSSGFDYWCNWLDLNPVATRSALLIMLGRDRPGAHDGARLVA